MNIRKEICVAMGTLAMIATSFSAVSAQSLSPNSTVTVNSPISTISGSILASENVLFTGYTGNPPTTVFTGNLYAAVLNNDSTNPYGTDKLTFVYQIHNGDADTLARLTTSSFSGFSTTVAQSTADTLVFDPTKGIGSGTTGATTADRSNNAGAGNTVGFTLAGVDPNQTSDVFFVYTDATAYAVGSTNIIDDGVATMNSYAPTAAVPEPSSVAAFAFTGMGLLGLMLFARKRRSSMTA